MPEFGAVVAVCDVGAQGFAGCCGVHLPPVRGKEYKEVYLPNAERNWLMRDSNAALSTAPP